MRRTCHVCGREAAIWKDGRIAKHYRRSETGRRELCLGGGQMYRPPLSAHFTRSKRGAR